jgi:lipid-A-disaccharide synthase
MRIALTANGPGEVAGWLRPLLRSLYHRRPDLVAFVFLVPDDYATGFEAQMVRDAFPQAHVYEPKSYLKFALGGRLEGLPADVDLVQYIGGDLLHAARVHARLRGRAATYKFSRRAYRKTFVRAFAVDARNAEQLAAWGTPPERIEVVGNLAIDGALFEASLGVDDGATADGILIMPGSRSYEVENLVPFYFAVALRMLRERPGLPIGFAISPFTSRAQVRAAIEGGGHPRMFGRRGRFVSEDGSDYLATESGDVRIPVVRDALAAATRARLILTIPGTKTIELAVLGKPAITITPLNAPEVVTINGPLTYLNRVPLIGIPLKRAVATRLSRRFIHHTQPNIDANAPLMREVHGTITPGRLARIALESYDDRTWLASSGEALARLYRDHAGAADRMSESLLALAA